ncbi:MAG: DUF5131 family protein [Bacteroidota bacterium]
MKRWGKLKPVRFDEKELKCDLGKNKFIFVGSGCDMFAENIPNEWIDKTIDHLINHENQYLFQSKNPQKILKFLPAIKNQSVVCTTIETNFWLNVIMRNSPSPIKRVEAMNNIAGTGIKTYVTIEPIMSFDVKKLTEYVSLCMPAQVNIGADSGHIENHKLVFNLPEPNKQEILELISELEKFTVVKLKSNLNRLMK